MKDERERAYWDEPRITPEGEQAWRVWKDDYVASRVEDWITDGTAPADAVALAGLVLAEFEEVDGTPWMPIGPALGHRMSAQLGLTERLDDPVARLDFIRAIRTIEACSDVQRTLASAYHLGISATEAERLAKKARASQVPASESTAVYRHYDEAGVADSQVEWFPTRTAAENAEREAIQDETPVFNDTHNRANRAAAVEYLFSALEGASSSTGTHTHALPTEGRSA